MKATNQDSESQSGLTLVEVSLASVMVAALAVVVIQSLHSLSTTQTFIREQARLGELAERITIQLVEDVANATKIWKDDDADAPLMHLKMQFGEVPTAPGSAYPVATNRGFFVADTVATVETGNALFFARSASMENFEIGTPLVPRVHRVDMFRFVRWSTRVRADGSLDLDRYGTVRVARYNDFANVINPVERVNLITALLAAGVDTLWHLHKTADVSFYKIEPVTGARAYTITDKVLTDPLETGNGLASSHRAFVAPNAHDIPPSVPEYATPGAVNFPGGLEIKLDGDGHGGLLMVRLVLASPPRAGTRQGFAVSQRIVNYIEE